MNKKDQTKKDKQPLKDADHTKNIAETKGGPTAPGAQEPVKPAKVSATLHRAIESRGPDSTPDDSDLLIRKQRVRILCVDDDLVQVKLVMRMLERLGYQCVGTTECNEALALFNDSPDRFDLIISDLTMPAMSGRELGRRIRKVRQDIPIILCTGYGILDDRYFDDELYVNAYISKPFTLRKIDDIIRTVLKKSFQLFY